MEVYLDGVNNYVDFYVIEIINDKDPYLALLGIYWNFSNECYIEFQTAADVF